MYERDIVSRAGNKLPRLCDYSIIFRYKLCKNMRENKQLEMYFINIK